MTAVEIEIKTEPLDEDSVVIKQEELIIKSEFPDEIPQDHTPTSDFMVSIPQCLLIPKKELEEEELNITSKELKEEEINCTSDEPLNLVLSHNHDTLLEEQAQPQTKTVFQCDTCNRNFSSAKELADHRRLRCRNHNNCEICGQVFRTKIILEKHLQKHRSREKYLTMKQTKALNALIKLPKKSPVKAVKAKPERRNKTLICNICEMTFTTVGALMHHNVLHNKKKYFCSKCGKSFRYKIDLDKHQQGNRCIRAAIRDVLKIAQQEEKQKKKLATLNKPVEVVPITQEPLEVVPRTEEPLEVVPKIEEPLEVVPKTEEPIEEPNNESSSNIIIEKQHQSTFVYQIPSDTIITKIEADEPQQKAPSPVPMDYEGLILSELLDRKAKSIAKTKTPSTNPLIEKKSVETVKDLEQKITPIRLETQKRKRKQTLPSNSLDAKRIALESLISFSSIEDTIFEPTTRKSPLILGGFRSGNKNYLDPTVKKEFSESNNFEQKIPPVRQSLNKQKRKQKLPPGILSKLLAKASKPFVSLTPEDEKNVEPIVNKNMPECEDFEQKITPIRQSLSMQIPKQILPLELKTNLVAEASAPLESFRSDDKKSFEPSFEREIPESNHFEQEIPPILQSQIKGKTKQKLPLEFPSNLLTKASTHLVPFRSEDENSFGSSVEREIPESNNFDQKVAPISQSLNKQKRKQKLPLEPKLVAQASVPLESFKSDDKTSFEPSVKKEIPESNNFDQNVTPVSQSLNKQKRKQKLPLERKLVEESGVPLESFKLDYNKSFEPSFEKYIPESNNFEQKIPPIPKSQIKEKTKQKLPLKFPSNLLTKASKPLVPFRSEDEKSFEPSVEKEIPESNNLDQKVTPICQSLNRQKRKWKLPLEPKLVAQASVPLESFKSDDKKSFEPSVKKEIPESNDLGQKVTPICQSLNKQKKIKKLPREPKLVEEASVSLESFKSDDKKSFEPSVKKEIPESNNFDQKVTPNCQSLKKQKKIQKLPLEPKLVAEASAALESFRSDDRKSFEPPFEKEIPESNNFEQKIPPILLSQIKEKTKQELPLEFPSNLLTKASKPLVPLRSEDEKSFEPYVEKEIPASNNFDQTITPICQSVEKQKRIHKLPLEPKLVTKASVPLESFKSDDKKSFEPSVKKEFAESNNFAQKVTPICQSLNKQKRKQKLALQPKLVEEASIPVESFKSGDKKSFEPSVKKEIPENNNFNQTITPICQSLERKQKLPIEFPSKMMAETCTPVVSLTPENEKSVERVVNNNMPEGEDFEQKIKTIHLTLKKKPRQILPVKLPSKVLIETNNPPKSIELKDDKSFERALNNDIPEIEDFEQKITANRLSLESLRSDDEKNVKLDNENEIPDESQIFEQEITPICLHRKKNKTTQKLPAKFSSKLPTETNSKPLVLLKPEDEKSSDPTINKGIPEREVFKKKITPIRRNRKMNKTKENLSIQFSPQLPTEANSKPLVSPKPEDEKSSDPTINKGIPESEVFERKITPIRQNRKMNKTKEKLPIECSPQLPTEANGKSEDEKSSKPTINKGIPESQVFEKITPIRQNRRKNKTKEKLPSEYVPKLPTDANDKPLVPLKLEDEKSSDPAINKYVPESEKLSVEPQSKSMAEICNPSVSFKINITDTQDSNQKVSPIRIKLKKRKKIIKILQDKKSEFSQVTDKPVESLNSDDEIKQDLLLQTTFQQIDEAERSLAFTEIYKSKDEIIQHLTDEYCKVSEIQMTDESSQQSSSIVASSQSTDVPGSVFYSLYDTSPEFNAAMSQLDTKYRYTWVCPECPQRNFQRYAFTKHLTSEHYGNKSSFSNILFELKPELYYSPKNMEDNYCHLCHLMLTGADSFRKHKEEFHKEHKTARAQFKCEKCGKYCSSRSALMNHVKADCGREPQHECDVCGKRFYAKSTLTIHKTMHTGVLPHECRFCHKRFRTKGQLTVHTRTHTGERPFPCKVCERRFTHRETLISHLSRHINVKRYQCCGCQEFFSSISGLKHHRLYRLDTCGKFKLNARPVGPRVRVIKGNVMFEPQPKINPHQRRDDSDENCENQNVNATKIQPVNSL